MIISRPKEYIEILLKEIIELTKQATNNMVHENFKGICSFQDSRERFDYKIEQVEELKKEILMLCENLTKQNEGA